MAFDMRILLVDDHTAYREFIKSLLCATSGLRVVGEADDGLDAVAKAQELSPDVVLMDVGLPQLNGFEAARRILETVPSSRIIFLTQENDPEAVTAALKSGAWGYVVKQGVPGDLLDALAAIGQDKRFVSKGLLKNTKTD